MIRTLISDWRYHKTGLTAEFRGNWCVPSSETSECVFWTLYFVVSDLKVFSDRSDWFVV